MPKQKAGKKKKGLKEKLKDKGKKVKDKLLGKSGSGGKRRKKTAQWYAKEIQRLQLKKKYEKQKMRL